ncbi:MAG TPA: NAD(P)-dependent oxidoreductase [Nitrososphaerales archaeon]|nr:NAD(P)-dependent oxidoreductase [Nitrososphaerales archaeon]
MKILVTGVTGQLGSRLAEEAMSRGHSVVGTHFASENPPPFSSRVDLIDGAAVRVLISRHEPDLVINCVALTNVEQCESDKPYAEKANIASVVHLVEAIRNTSTILLHISTDFVFDGVKGNYIETDSKNPINVYGWTKSEAEEVILREMNEDRFLIARSGGIIDFRKGSRNIGRVLLDAVQDGHSIGVIADQITTFIHAREEAKVLLDLIENRCCGIYHVGGNRPSSRYDLATTLLRKLGIEKPLFHAIGMNQFEKWKVPRPERTNLNVAKCEKALNRKIPTIEEMLDAYLSLN